MTYDLPFESVPDPTQIASRKLLCMHQHMHNYDRNIYHIIYKHVQKLGILMMANKK